MPQPRLPLPPEPAVYSGLHTDHYPWTEVTSDLLTRQGQGLTRIFLPDSRVVVLRGNGDGK